MMCHIYKSLTVVSLLLVSASCVLGEDAPKKFIIPDFTLSPSRNYGVTVPIFALTENDKPAPTNNLVDMHNGNTLAVIHASVGYERALNYREPVPARWSKDETLVVWTVEGKWNPSALVALRLQNGQVLWQRDLLALGQKAILERTQKAAPTKYAESKKANAGNGSVYPDGFTICVDVLDPISLPLHMRVVLTSNPKRFPDFPTLNSHLDAVLDEQGEFKVTAFKLGSASSSHV